ncbi:hypothetical protein FB451DRAFT_1556316, partial [Mycena latifolia]
MLTVDPHSDVYALRLCPILDGSTQRCTPRMAVRTIRARWNDCTGTRRDSGGRYTIDAPCAWIAVNALRAILCLRRLQYVPQDNMCPVPGSATCAETLFVLRRCPGASAQHPGK